MSYINAIVGEFMTPEGPIVNPQYQAPKWLTEERYAEMHTATWTPKIEQHFLDGVLISQTIQYTPKGKKEPFPKNQFVKLTNDEIESCWKSAMKLDNGKGADITNQPFFHLARIVEELLKEKNHG